MFRSLVGRSTGIVAVRRFIDSVAAKQSNAMLLGESGTGKEVVARNIHYLSKKRGRPFISVDCRLTAPASLVFEHADGGTLYLNEVGDLDLDQQFELLRVLENRSFKLDGDGRRVAPKSKPTVVATSHRDLQAMIAEQRFLKDLYDDLAVAAIAMPPLRERREDIPLLVLEIHARLKRQGRSPKSISDRALRAMLAYDWPGNIRELSTLIDHCSTLTTSISIEIEDLPQRIRGFASSVDSANTFPLLRDADGAQAARLDFETIELRGLLQLLETRLIRRALDQSVGGLPAAASQLGLRQTALIEKMRNYGIAPSFFDSAEA